MTVRALIEVIANQRHRSTRVHSGKLRLRKNIQPLEALLATDLDFARLGYDPHQFDDIITLQHRKTPLHF
jgi:hypothetical protein